MTERKFAKIVVEEKIDGIALTIQGDDQKIEVLLMELVKSLYAKRPAILKEFAAKLIKINIAKGALGLIGSAINEGADG